MLRELLDMCSDCFSKQIPFSLQMEFQGAHYPVIENRVTVAAHTPRKGKESTSTAIQLFRTSD